MPSTYTAPLKTGQSAFTSTSNLNLGAGLNTALGKGLSIDSSGSLLKAGQPVQSQNTNTANALTSALLPSTIKPTSTGGVVFAPQKSASQTFTLPSGLQYDASSGSTNGSPSLSSFLTNNSSYNGGTISTTGGQVSGYTPPPSFSIDTSNIPSSALTGNTTGGDLSQGYGTYQGFVNNLAQAQGYSPEYIQALQGQYGAQTQGAQLGLNQAQLNSNFYTGNNLPGDTVSYAQGATAKAAAQQTLNQAQNSIQQLAANQALNTAQLQRTGNIASAQTQLQYNPVAIAGQNAINQYNSLQEQYPNASIPEYNNQLSPSLNQQIAQELVANSPAYRAQFQSTYQTPGGGTGIYSKLDVSGLQQNANGGYDLVPAAAAALGSANANVVQTQLGNLSNINSAISASQKTLETTKNFMNQYGLNQSGVSILSQIQNSTNKNLNKAGAVAGLNADLNALRADYAQYLVGRGGSIAGTNEEANKAIPDTISASQLETLVKEMQTAGQNTADAVSQQVNQALQGIRTGTVGSTSSSGRVGTSWDNL